MANNSNSKYKLFIESIEHVLTICGSRSWCVDAPSFRFQPDSFVRVNSVQLKQMCGTADVA